MNDRPGLGIEGLYSVIYWALCLVFVVPPREVSSAGVTIQNIFARFLGDVTVDFVKYHIRRSCVTLIVHSLLPLGELHCNIVLQICLDNLINVSKSKLNLMSIKVPIKQSRTPIRV